MKNVLLAISFIGFYFNSIAQVPYPLVTPGAKYYTDGSEIYYLETKFLRKEGNFNAISVYEINKQVVKITEMDTLAWIGNHMGSKNFSISIVNDLGLSSGYIGNLAIEPWMNVGKTFTAINLPSGNQVIGKIKSTVWDTFLGVSDSVKTITFSLKQASTLPEEKMYDSLFYKISRKYGIIETRILEYKQAVGVLTKVTGSLGKKIRIIGITENKLGWKPRSPYEFFNYNIGDQLFYSVSASRDWVGSCLTSGTILLKITDKKVTKDSLIYQMGKSSNYTYNCQNAGENVPRTFKVDTLFKINSWLNSNNSYEIKLYYFNYANKDSIMYRHENYPVYSPGDYTFKSKFQLGKGLVSSHSNNGLGGWYTLTLGDYIITSITSETDIKDKFVISPNPAHNSLHLSPNTQGYFQLLNTSGVEILFKQLSEENIDISKISPGMYFYKIISDQKVLKTGKLIIQ
ncbi:MAG: T9SS type A sorting domain-containing protein [Opitutaceae bacterium]|nr:T9SS type A sorting domain-containing protein [Cytophagales bacterium]